MKLRQIVQIIEENQEIDYTNIPKEIVSELQNYKPHYREWAVREINSGGTPISVTDALKYYIDKVPDNRFKEILSKYTPTPKNILTLNLSQVKDSQQLFDEKYNSASKRSIKKALKNNYTDAIFDNGYVKIIKITRSDDSDGAARIASDMARGTKWCVTDVGIADNYLKLGPLYLIVVNDQKFLMHTQSEQFMDVSDDQVYIDDFHRGVTNIIINNVPQSARLAKIDGEVYESNAHKDPVMAVNYAKEVLRRRWRDLEPVILQDGNAAIDYFETFINGEWKEQEHRIRQNPQFAALYAERVIKGRWPEAEPAISKDPKAALKYAANVIKGRWPEAESIIAQNPEAAIDYATSVIRGRWPEAEPVISKSPLEAMHYIRRFIGGRWPEAEPAISTNPGAAYKYALHVLKRRWPDGESIIATDPHIAYQYAIYVLKSRFLEAEQTILSDSDMAQLYKRHFGI